MTLRFGSVDCLIQKRMSPPQGKQWHTAKNGLWRLSTSDLIWNRFKILKLSLLMVRSYTHRPSFVTYIVLGLMLEGASYSGNRLSLNNGQSIRLGPSQLRWVQVELSDDTRKSTVNLPVYLNNDRSDVLFTVNLPFEEVGSNLVAMRAVCLTAGG